MEGESCAVHEIPADGYSTSVDRCMSDIHDAYERCSQNDRIRAMGGALTHEMHCDDYRIFLAARKVLVSQVTDLLSDNTIPLQEKDRLRQCWSKFQEFGNIIYDGVLISESWGHYFKRKWLEIWVALRGR